MRILVVEDDPMQAEILEENLSEEGYAVDVAYTGEEGEALAESISYDVIILDNKLPGKKGFEVCFSLRQKKVASVIIIISGFMTSDQRIVQGLDCGADEYLIKPVHSRVLCANIRALMRKKQGITKTRIKVGNVVLDTIYRLVWQGNKEIKLTRKEYIIFEYLAEHINMAVTRTELEQHDWNMELDTDSNIVDQHIKNLRKKLGEGVLIETVKGIGYRLKEQPEISLVI